MDRLKRFNEATDRGYENGCAAVTGILNAMTKSHPAVVEQLRRKRL
jgi:uncharacterized membrane-anchored protein